MNLIQKSVQQITRENLKNYYDTEQAEDELFNMLTIKSSLYDER